MVIYGFYCLLFSLNFFEKKTPADWGGLVVFLKSSISWTDELDQLWSLHFWKHMNCRNRHVMNDLSSSGDSCDRYACCILLGWYPSELIPLDPLEKKIRELDPTTNLAYQLTVDIRWLMLPIALYTAIQMHIYICIYINPSTVSV